MPYASVAFLMSGSFGVLSLQAGFSVLQTIVASAIIFAGSAQFAALAIVTVGGSIPAALAAGAMMNSRFLAMGMALAPSLPGGPLQRALQGQAVVDSSWVLGGRGDGTFDRWIVFGSTAPQYVAWVAGTVLGAAVGGGLGDPDRFGLDAIFPTFFLGLLLIELRNPRRLVAAGLAAALTLALVPVTPPGVPVLAASLAALIGLRTPRADAGPGGR
nr:AzlC family ABC transporter permease [Kineosphaera limosa]